MLIPLIDVPDEIERRHLSRVRGDLTIRSTYTIPSSVIGKVQVAADKLGVSKSKLVTLLLDLALDDFAEQFEELGWNDEEDDE